MSDSRDNRFWFGFFLGGLIGAIILFFLGTKEGKKAGKEIRLKSEDIIDDLQGRLDELKEKGRELADEGERLKAKVAEKIETGKGELAEDIVEKLDRTLSHIEAIQERGRESTASLRKNLFKNLPKKS